MGCAMRGSVSVDSIRTLGVRYAVLTPKLKDEINEARTALKDG